MKTNSAANNAASSSNATNNTNINVTNPLFDNNFTQYLSSTSSSLSSLNNIKEQITQLNYNPSQRQFFEDYINPLLNTFSSLSISILNFSTAAAQLVQAANSENKLDKVKDLRDLSYEVLDLCEDIYPIIKKRVKIASKTFKL